MKKQTLRRTACVVAAAMTLTGLVGCGRNENKQTGQETTKTTTTKTDGDSETSEISDVTDEVVVVDVDITQYPWVLSHEFSEEEFLTLPAEAKFYGIELPITKEDIYSMSYSNNAYDSVEAAKDVPATDITFYDKDRFYPDLRIYNVDNITVGEAMDTNRFEWAEILDYNTFDISKKDEDAFHNAHEDWADEEILLDMMVAKFGAPNYFNYFSDEKDVKKVINNMMSPENADNSVNGMSGYSFLVGWQFEEFAIAATYYEAASVSNEIGYYTTFVPDVVLYYFPIERGTISECFQETYGDNIVSDLINERNNIFGNVTYLGANADIQALVNGAWIASATTDTSESEDTTGTMDVPDSQYSSNYVETDHNFDETANDNYMFIEDHYVIQEQRILLGSTSKGVFHVGDTVYVQFTNGTVVEAAIKRINQNNEDVQSSVSGQQLIVILDEGLDLEDHEYLRGAIMVTK